MKDFLYLSFKIFRFHFFDSLLPVMCFILFFLIVCFPLYLTTFSCKSLND
ncbi:hypothetical protein E1A91_A10G000200v1 [Gossypium mustelinum]|uniref:Uncharacterized protein n=1 Tax=Gossypium mustelinum TaxID=34275 RepID=A0A5D2XG84_GOSMU|nr:hypothetical protein E1A91_A10G000200v1 [Gossypium mustelinum]